MMEKNTQSSPQKNVYIYIFKYDPISSEDSESFVCPDLNDI